MKTSFDHRPLAVAGLLLAGAVLVADGTRFSDFTPLPSSAGPTADEAHPITFGNPAFRQESIADRSTQLAAGMLRPGFPSVPRWRIPTILRLTTTATSTSSRTAMAPLTMTSGSPWI